MTKEDRDEGIKFLVESFQMMDNNDVKEAWLLIYVKRLRFYGVQNPEQALNGFEPYIHEDWPCGFLLTVRQIWDRMGAYEANYGRDHF